MLRAPALLAVLAVSLTLAAISSASTDDTFEPARGDLDCSGDVTTDDLIGGLVVVADTGPVPGCLHAVDT